MTNANRLERQPVHSSKHTSFNDSGKTVLISEKRVRFYEKLHVVNVLHRKDMTQNEISSAWYKKCEIMKIKIKLEHDIKFIKNGGTLDNFTNRGLEERFSATRVRRPLNKLNAVMAVLEEQDRQIMQGNNDESKIRHIYLRFSRYSQSEAKKIAKADERDVQMINRDEQMKLTCAKSVCEKSEKSIMRKEILFAKLVATRKLNQMELNSTSLIKA
jgi:hypothetical protein